MNIILLLWWSLVVSLAAWWIGRRTGTGLRLAHVGAYTAAQIVGAILGPVWPTSCTACPP